MEPKVTKTPEQALRMLMNRCAKAECCLFDVRRSMSRWAIDKADQQRIVDRLVSEKFIDERRYAAAYVREKVNLSRWGIYKIRAALRAKCIDELVITESLGEVDPERLTDKLDDLLRRKRRSVRAANDYQLRGKLLRYGTSLGYDFESVNDAIGRIMENNDYDE